MSGTEPLAPDGSAARAESRVRGSAAPVQLAIALGVAGSVPLLAHAFFSWISPVQEMRGVLRSQLQYAAVLLSFIGAVHWGVALAGRGFDGAAAGRRLIWGVVPAAFAWVVSLYPPPLALPVMAGAMLVVLLVDWRLHSIDALPRWFFHLRVALTVVALLALLATWWAASSRLGR